MKIIGEMVVKKLDKNDNAEIELFEKAFYKAFSISYMNTLGYIWNIDDKNRRISTKVLYDTQEIFIARSPLRVYAGMAVNFGTENRQFEMMGFSCKENPGKVCEILHLFCLLDNMYSRAIIEEMSNGILDLIKERKIEVMYCTCSRRRVAQYSSLGFSLVDQKNFEGEIEYLLKNTGNIKNEV